MQARTLISLSAGIALGICLASALRSFLYLQPAAEVGPARTVPPLDEGKNRSDGRTSMVPAVPAPPAPSALRPAPAKSMDGEAEGSQVPTLVLKEAADGFEHVRFKTATSSLTPEQEEEATRRIRAAEASFYPIYVAAGRERDYSAACGLVPVRSWLLSSTEMTKIREAADVRPESVGEEPGNAMIRLAQGQWKVANPLGSGEFLFIAVSNGDEFVQSTGREAFRNWADPMIRRDTLTLAAGCRTRDQLETAERHGHDTTSFRVLRDEDIDVVERHSDALYIELQLLRRELWGALRAAAIAGGCEALDPQRVSAVFVRRGHMVIVRKGDDADIDAQVERMRLERQAVRGRVEELLR